MDLFSRYLCKSKAMAKFQPIGNLNYMLKGKSLVGKDMGNCDVRVFDICKK